MRRKAELRTNRRLERPWMSAVREVQQSKALKRCTAALIILNVLAVRPRTEGGAPIVV